MVWRVLVAIALILTSAGTLAWSAAAPGADAQSASLTPPIAPELSAPADGITVQDAWRDVDLQWNAVPDAHEYQVVINDGERTGPWIAKTSWSPGSLPEGAYTWTVRARNGAGIGEPGQDFSFIIAPRIVANAETIDPLPFPLMQTASDDLATADTATSSTNAPTEGESTLAVTPDAAGTPVPVDAVTADPSVTAVGESDGANARESTSAVDGTITVGGANGGDEEVLPAPVPAPAPDSDDDNGNGNRNKSKSKNNDKDKNSDKRSDTGTGDGQDGEKRDGRAGEGSARDDRDRPDRNASNGNGGVSEVIAEPLYYQMPVELKQQDAEDATAGATGESGTVNGVPRESSETAPVVTTGPGAPLPPGEVMLPPSVPGLPGAPPVNPELPAPGGDPALAGGIGGTTELVIDAASDTTVFTSAPNAPQSPESVGLLAIGGAQGAVTLVSFDVTGVGEGVVLSALLTFTGAGDTGGPGGSVGVIYDYVVPDGLTANGVPDGGSALNVHGAPAWFEAVEPGGLTAIDVTGSVFGDGAITFVLPGQSEASASMYSVESGVPPQLILTVALPA